MEIFYQMKMKMRFERSYGNTWPWLVERTNYLTSASVAIFKKNWLTFFSKFKKIVFKIRRKRIERENTLEIYFCLNENKNGIQTELREYSALIGGEAESKRTQAKNEKMKEKSISISPLVSIDKRIKEIWF